MIVLDTNVVSEAIKSDPHPGVGEWLNEQSADTLYLSSVTLAELLFAAFQHRTATSPRSPFRVGSSSLRATRLPLSLPEWPSSTLGSSEELADSNRKTSAPDILLGALSAQWAKKRALPVKEGTPKSP